MPRQQAKGFMASERPLEQVGKIALRAMALLALEKARQRALETKTRYDDYIVMVVEEIVWRFLPDKGVASATPAATARSGEGDGKAEA